MGIFIKEPIEFESNTYSNVYMSFNSQAILLNPAKPYYVLHAQYTVHQDSVDGPIVFLDCISSPVTENERFGNPYEVLYRELKLKWPNYSDV